MKKRLEFLDLAKGICIILVVMLHSEIFVPLENYLSMPLFFFISGMFYKDYGGLREFLKKKISKLLIPFLFFYIIGCFFDFASTKVMGKVSTYHYFTDWWSIWFFNNGLWFLLCLFWCNIICYLISVIAKNRYLKGGVVFFLTICGYILWKSNHFIPLHVSTSMMAVSFFYVGGVVKKRLALPLLGSVRWNIPVAIILLTLVYVSHKYVIDGNVIWYLNDLEGFVFVYYLYAFLMIFAVLLISEKITKLPFVSFCGRYSLIILGIHILFVKTFKTLFELIGYPSKLFTFILTMFMCVLCIPVLIKYFPYFTGQRDCIIEKK